MKLIKRAVDKEIICFQLLDLAKEICQLMPMLFLQLLLYIITAACLGSFSAGLGKGGLKVWGLRD